MRYILLLFFLSISAFSFAQKDYTDFTPSYTVKYDYYIIDKIEYKSDRIILFFRFVCNDSQYTGATFFTKGGRHPWFLKPKNGAAKINLIEIRNVRRDEELVAKKVTEPNYSVSSLTRTGHTVYTCEIHFPLPPEGVKEVDLIEGLGMEDSDNFNCFNMKLRQAEDNDLGSKEERKKKIYEFEKKFGIERNKPEPKVEPEPKPEPNNTTTDNHKPSTNVKNLTHVDDLKCGELLVLSNVHFKDNSTEFKGAVAAKQTLFIIYNYMHENPNTTITLYGHTDIFGDKEENKELSKQRVYKIFRWLNSIGIKSKRINYEWFGSDQPLIEDGSPDNRRVEIKLHCN